MTSSMTGYASATTELASDTSLPPLGVSVELRSVNSRFLDLHFRMPEEVRSSEQAIRELLLSKLGRGKVEIRVNLQRNDANVTAGAINRAALLQLVSLERQVISLFGDAQRLRVGEILRWPGVLAESSIAADTLRETVLNCARRALDELLGARSREGAQLAQMLLQRVADMEAIVADLTPRVPEQIARQQQKIVDRLREALSVAQSESALAIPADEVAERIRQEVTVYAIKIDVAEELSRLSAHLKETRQIIEGGGRVGKRLDFMMQELNREANTLGSKAVAKELADASMSMKLLIEQMREQVQNLE